MIPLSSHVHFQMIPLFSLVNFSCFLSFHMFIFQMILPPMNKWIKFIYFHASTFHMILLFPCVNFSWFLYHINFSHESFIFMSSFHDSFIFHFKKKKAKLIENFLGLAIWTLVRIHGSHEKKTTCKAVPCVFIVFNKTDSTNHLINKPFLKGYWCVRALKMLKCAAQWWHSMRSIALKCHSNASPFTARQYIEPHKNVILGLSCN